MFSQTAEYALRAMACLALSPEEMVPTSALAATTQVPSNYLAKVLQQLAAANLVTGRRGVGGGYRLTRHPRDINLLEIINAVGILKRIEECPLGIGTHGTRLCALHRTMDRATAAVIDVVRGVTLHDLVSEPGEVSRPLCETNRAVKVNLTLRNKRDGR
jgi:Rrf2 family nitric oxide-sensitive transcriptional repressor